MTDITKAAPNVPAIDTLRREILKTGIPCELAGIITGLASEYAMQAYLQGYERGYNQGYANRQSTIPQDIERLKEIELYTAKMVCGVGKGYITEADNKRCDYYRRKTGMRYDATNNRLIALTADEIAELNETKGDNLT